MSNIESALTRLLSGFVEIRLAFLFGSQVTGDVTAESDIDLALLMDAPLTDEFKINLIDIIASQFGCPVDVVDLYAIPEPIVGQVLKGKRLLGDNVTYANLLNRHLLNVADFLPLRNRILSERRSAWTK